MIRVWKTEHDFIVAINHDCYEMDANAYLPNGVCIYLGQTKDIDFHSYQELAREEDIPLGILRQVVNLVRTDVK